VRGQLHAPVALPREKAPGTRWIGGLVGPTASLDVVAMSALQNSEESCSSKYRIIFPSDFFSSILCPYLGAGVAHSV
jgi:hypothetical protein